MSRLFKLLTLIGASMLVSAVIFGGFYFSDENIEAASTGFNAGSKGVFGWDYSYAEHSFEPDGDGYRMVLIDYGREIRRDRLIAEIILCLGIGYGIVIGGWLIRRAILRECFPN